MKRLLLITYLSLATLCTIAQPANDLWKNAISILPDSIPFPIGKFSSTKVSLNKADFEINEPFDQVISSVALHQKTVWFKFNLITARNVEIALRQNDTLIQPLDIGMSVYSKISSYPNASNLDPYLRSIPQQGALSNVCIPAGEYYIQVCARNKVTDSIWIDLNLKETEVEGNSNKNPILLETGSVQTLNNCFSIDSLIEAYPFHIDNVSKSGYARFTTPTNQVKTYLSLSGNYVGIVVYEGNLSGPPSSWKAIRTYSWFDGSHGYNETFNCGDLKQGTTYTIKFIGLVESFASVYVRHEMADPPIGVSPLAPLNVKVKSNESSYQRVQKNLHCDNYNALKLCQNLHHHLYDTVPVLNTNREYIYVPIKAQAGIWVTFTLDRYMYLSVTNVFSTKGTTMFLFNGIAKNDPCELQDPVVIKNNSFNDCLAPGEYTLLTATHLHDTTYYGRIWNAFVGKSHGFDLNFYPPIYKNIDRSVRFPKPTSSLDLGSRDVKNRILDVSISEDFVNGDKTTYPFADSILTGFFSFARFKINDSAHFSFKPKSVTRYYGYQAKIYEYKNLANYSKWRPVETPYQNFLYNYHQTKKQPPGNYIIVFYRKPPERCDAVDNQLTNHILVLADNFTNPPPPPPNPKCVHYYNAAKNAFKVNGLAPIDLDYKNPEFQDRCWYKLETTCTRNPKNLNNIHWVNYMDYRKKITGFSYYVFKTDEPVSLTIYATSFFQLLSGNISTDSVNVPKPKNVLEEYALSGYTRCYLKPGEYTVIIDATPYTSGGSIEFNRTGYSLNDHATHAQDAGMFTKDRTQASYSGIHSCRTSFDSLHAFNIPSTWHTFRVAGPGRIKVPYLAVRPFFFKASRGHDLTFDEVKKAGLIDSNRRDNYYEPVRLMSDGTTQQFYFEKLDFDTTRYYMLVYNTQNNGLHSFYKPYNEQITFEYDYRATKQGDSCENAFNLNLNGAKNAVAEGYVAAHKMGEGPGETDETKWHVYPSDYLKSSWFKLKVENNGGNKLKLWQNSNSNIYTFRIHYGSCRSLTPGPIITNFGSGVTLDCIRNGDYYVQALSFNTLRDDITIQVQTDSAFGACRQIDLNKVIANFNYSGGCDNDPVVFQNLSTIGSEIDYYWDFGDGKSDTILNPSHRYTKSVNKLDTYLVKLAVRNRITKRTDTFSRKVIIGELDISVKHDSLVCEHAFEPEIITNIPDANYEWRIYSDTFLNPNVISRDKRPYLYVSFNPTKYLASVVLGNCRSHKAVEAYSLRTEFIQNQRTYAYWCTGDSFVFKLPDNWQGGMRWPGSNDTVRSVTLDTANFYQYTVISKGCEIPMQLSLLKIPEPILSHLDTVCFTNSMTIHDLTGQYVPYGNTGKPYEIDLEKDVVTYPITFRSRNFGSCPDIPDTVHIKHIWDTRLNFLDTFVCNSEPFQLTAGDNNSQVIWSTGDSTNTINVTQTGIYTAIVSNKNCQFYDTSFVTFLNGETLPPLSAESCFADSGITLSVPNNAKLLWSNGDTTNSSYFEKEGKYWLSVIDPYCPVTDTFSLTNSCQEGFFMPNAFTPNGDVFNPEFIAKGTNITQFEMRIFARNGQQVFQTNSIDEGWNGTLLGEPLPLGSYYYLVTYTQNKQTQQHQGIVTLVR
ncbi:MAG: gliding motility-associated C-terminal domain-containing protein [Bacteroidetes bacterium]|nr:gliding motility-associated C-terminal domain-containing protein [Bacteroidota bacterium]